MVLRFYSLVIPMFFALTGCQMPGAIAPEDDPVSSYHKFLADEYQAYAEAELEEGFTEDAATFMDKAMRARAGEDVPPHDPMNFTLDDDLVATLAASRKQLLATLTPQAKRAFPREAARAQLLYDCWLDQLSHHLQNDSPPACAQALTDTLQQISRHASGQRPQHHYRFEFAATDRVLDEDHQKHIEEIALMAYLKERYVIEIVSPPGDGAFGNMIRDGLLEWKVDPSAIVVLQAKEGDSRFISVSDDDSRRVIVDLH